MVAVWLAMVSWSAIGKPVVLHSHWRLAATSLRYLVIANGRYAAADEQRQHRDVDR
jgi:hypothetical protein